MAKIRVSELAKKLGKTSKELLACLKELGIAAKTAASSIEEESAKIVSDLLAPKKEEPRKVVTVNKLEKPQEKVKAKPEPKVIEVKPEIKSEIKPEPIPEPMPKMKITIPVDGIVLKELADKLKAPNSVVIKELMKKGMLVTINQKVSSDIAKEISENLNFIVEIETPKAVHHEDASKLEKAADLKNRPPVVTIMGHVDHGKTKLLDAIRSTKVVESEAGGITQHIGAYQVQIKGKKITFLDTPGHEAFTALRARGASVTDIVVLIVAADDGVMPQTIEAIDHAKAAKVPIIVAINKIDKPDANPDRVKQQLSEHGLQSEDWGGDTVTVPVSAKQKIGIDELLEMILLVADMQELKANPDAKAAGVVIEAKIEKGMGPVATVLIKNGTLFIGDVFTMGSTYGKVRALISDRGDRIKKAGPSTPVGILGISEVPSPGDTLIVADSDKEAKELAETNRLSKARPTARVPHTLEDFSKNIEGGEHIDLNLILKADVQGSLEALIQSLKDISTGNQRVNIIHAAVGNIAESDVLLAEASNAILIGFNVEVDARARDIAESEEIKIKIYSIIYKLLDDIKLALEGMLAPEYEEVLVGRAEVRQLFKFSKVGAIAGSYITSGKFVRGLGLRIFRKDQKIYEGKIESLKRFKDDAKEVHEGYECGIAISGYEDFEVGDQLECFEVREKIKK